MDEMIRRIVRKYGTNPYAYDIPGKLEAIKNCRTSNNTDWEQKHSEQATEILLEFLPHGAGIDCKWEIVFPAHGVLVVCSNSFHHTNDAGYYDGYIDFTLVIDKAWNTRVTGKFARDTSLRDYLEETLDFSIYQLKRLHQILEVLHYSQGTLNDVLAVMKEQGSTNFDFLLNI